MERERERKEHKSVRVREVERERKECKSVRVGEGEEGV